MSDAPAIPGLSVATLLHVGDLLTHEPSGLNGILVAGNPSSGVFTLMTAASNLVMVQIGLLDFGMWWRLERGGDVIKQATHDPKLLRQGIVREKEGR